MSTTLVSVGMPVVRLETTPCTVPETSTFRGSSMTVAVAVYFGVISSVAAEAKVEWFPTRLTTVTASVNRTIEESAIINSGGFLATTAGLQIDHELLRNVIITGNGTFENDAYNGIDRTDHLYSAGLSATYLLNHNVGLNVGYTYYKQTSGGLAAGPTFDLNRATVGLVLQF